MSLVASVLQYKPDDWTDDSYTTQHYHLVTVDKNTEEYMTLKAEFKSKYHKKIAKIERIQHPYWYGMFLIQKAQQTLNNALRQEKRIFQPIPNFGGTKLSDFINRNCDDRMCRPVSDQNYVVKKVLTTSTQCNSNSYAEYIITIARDSLATPEEGLDKMIAGLRL